MSGYHSRAVYRLSKSKLMSALQCGKRLYLEIHSPDLAQIEAGLQARFDVGHRVGEVARSLHRHGRLIGHADDPSAALEETKRALECGDDVLLFEPAFEHGGVLVRADMLFRRHGRCRLVEVKATTSVADHHLQDAAIQAWVIDGAGCPVDAVSIAHLDGAFVYPGGDNYRGLFSYVDVTQDIASLRAQVPALALRCQQILVGPAPSIAVGRQCREPYSCPFLSRCDRDAPTYPLSMLGQHWRLRERLAALGYRDLRDVPESEIGDGLPRRIWSAVVNGESFIDPNVAKLINDLEFPRYYLDFETIQFAIPIWPGTRPYEQLPFQWSCHAEHADGTATHDEFLDTTGDAPMQRCMEHLIAAVGNAGPVFGYSGFEVRILREAATRHPALAPQLNALAARVIDLLPIVRSNYYHPAQNGSWSIKAVAPTIAADLAYDLLEEVSDGGGAQHAYAEMIDRQTPPDRKRRLEESLRTYCRRDTEVMIRLARRLIGTT